MVQPWARHAVAGAVRIGRAVVERPAGGRNTRISVEGGDENPASASLLGALAVH